MENTTSAALVRTGEGGVTRPEGAAPLPARQHPVAVYLASLATANTRKNMGSGLDRIAAIIAGDQTPERLRDAAGRLIYGSAATQLDGRLWAALNYQVTAAIRAQLAQTVSPAMGNLALTALRGVLEQAFLLGLMSGEQWLRASKIEPLPAPSGLAQAAGRMLTTLEFIDLLDTCGADTALGARDAAILAVLFDLGLRVSEVVKLRRADVDLATRRVDILDAKGGKSRINYLRP